MVQEGGTARTRGGRRLAPGPGPVSDEDVRRVRQGSRKMAQRGETKSAMLVRWHTIPGTPLRDSDFGAMSGDDWDDVTPAARWGARWRELQREAIEIALEMSDANAQRHMLFVAKSYALLAERAEERRKRLLALAAAKPRVRS
jgi:hypothetical protein